MKVSCLTCHHGVPSSTTFARRNSMIISFKYRWYFLFTRSISLVWGVRFDLLYFVVLMSFVSTHLVQSLRYSVDLCAEVYRLQRNIMRAKQNIKGNCTYLRKRATDVSIDVWKRTDKIAPPHFHQKTEMGGLSNTKKWFLFGTLPGLGAKIQKIFVKTKNSRTQKEPSFVSLEKYCLQKTIVKRRA